MDALKESNPDVHVLDIEMDTSKETSVIDAVDQTIKHFGRVDIAVNNAGVGGPQKSTPEVELSEWENLMSINVTGVWLCQRAQIKQMLKQEPLASDGRHGRGVIVNVASMLGLVASSPAAIATAYTTSKHAVMGLTKTDAAQYAPEGIRINAMCPGYVETPLLKSARDSGFMAEELKKVPMQRLASMEEIADSIVYLASPLSSFVVGHGLAVDGGYTCL